MAAMESASGFARIGLAQGLAALARTVRNLSASVVGGDCPGLDLRVDDPFLELGAILELDLA